MQKKINYKILKLIISSLINYQTLEKTNKHINFYIFINFGFHNSYFFVKLLFILYCRLGEDNIVKKVEN